MRWLDVCGPPGVGKSTLCDPLWKPRDIQWNGEAPPPDWAEFLRCVDRLMQKIVAHPSYRACESMVQRSVRKMAAVQARRDGGTYVQTAFAQRGLGIGWRLKDQEAIAEYFALMPLSVGVVILSADVETICRRNVERKKDRSHMVKGMERPRAIALDVLTARGANVIALDTREPVEANRAKLIAAAQMTSWAA